MSRNTQHLRSSRSRRSGDIFAYTLGAIVLVGGLAVSGSLLYWRQTAHGPQDFMTAVAWKGPYVLSVSTRGTVRSASNVDLACEVRSRVGGTPILEVLPEGTIVKAGDKVVELDNSELLFERDQLRILISTRESLLATAQSTLRAAQIAKTEYLEGLYVTQEKQYVSELELAEQSKANAEAALRSAKVLFEKAIISAMQVEAVYASLDDANNKFLSAQTNLDTLRNLTKQKEMTLLDAAMASAEADLKAQQRNLQIEQTRLEQINNWLAKCTINAPAAGQVVYANDTNPYISSPFVVQPGAVVRERQSIVWLPDMGDLQVNVMVNESHITQIRAGLPVSIRADALDDQLLEGQVTVVGQFAEPAGYWNGNVNRYPATIKINNPSPDLRVGMTAEARILIEQMPEALQVPVEALAESQGRFFSLVKSGDEYETRELEIGSINDRVAAIDHGLEEGDEVVLFPRSAGSLLKLPDSVDATAAADVH